MSRAEYMREYRKRKPSVRRQDLARVRAYNEATRILRERHRDEFDAIYHELRDQS